MGAVEARAGAHDHGDRCERAGDGVEEDGERAVAEAPRLAQAAGHERGTAEGSSMPPLLASGATTR